MTDWMWWGIAGLACLTGLLALFFTGVHVYYRSKFLDQICRIFEERPLFIVPRGRPVAGAEDVRFDTPDGVTLSGCYLKAAPPRKGVILFGLEFGSNRWAAVQYCTPLLAAGYDVFAYEPRNQGESGKDPSYDPLQWVTDRDLADGRAALAYLKGRPDTHPGGVGILGVSKGGSVGLLLAAEDRWVRCVATDGAYATYTTMVPYMQRWVSIYSPYRRLQELMPGWLYGSIGLAAMRAVARRRGVRFLSVERAVRRMRQPVLMIHGGADTYIKPEMAEALFRKVNSKAKTLWVVEKAKHNQAHQTAGDEYHRRLVEFFDRYLGVEPVGDSAVVPVETPAESAGLATAS